MGEMFLTGIWTSGAGASHASLALCTTKLHAELAKQDVSAKLYFPATKITPC
jgi:hypothetical protein